MVWDRRDGTGPHMRLHAPPGQGDRTDLVDTQRRLMNFLADLADTDPGTPVGLPARRRKASNGACSPWETRPQ